MTNKEKLKVAIEQDINSASNYNEIIKKIEKGAKMKEKNNLWKWSLVPICLVAIITGFVLINNTSMLSPENPSSNKTYVDKDNSVYLKFNDISTPLLSTDIAGFAIDLTFEELIKEEKFIADFKILSSLNNSRLMKRYNMNNEFIGYDLIYYSANNNNQINKEIEIFLSKKLEKKPGCYENIELDKLDDSKIDNTNIKILKYKDDNYYVLFNFNEYNFDIETTNITEQELSALLLSILK